MKRIIKNRPYGMEEEVLEEGVLPDAILGRVKEQLNDVDKDRDVEWSSPGLVNCFLYFASALVTNRNLLLV